MTTPNPANVPAITNAQMSEFDYYLFIDMSGSMGGPRRAGSSLTRWSYVQEAAAAGARQLAGIDDDGLTLLFFNSGVQVHNGVKTPERVNELFTTIQPGGGTALLPALKAAEAIRAGSKKKSFYLIYTDGEANDSAELPAFITGLANSIDTDDRLSIQFIQVGDDKDATKMLEKLDDDLPKLGAKFDIVNTMKDIDADGLTLGQLVYLGQND